MIFVVYSQQIWNIYLSQNTICAARRCISSSKCGSITATWAGAWQTGGLVAKAWKRVRKPRNVCCRDTYQGQIDTTSNKESIQNWSSILQIQPVHLYICSCLEIATASPFKMLIIWHHLGLCAVTTTRWVGYNLLFDWIYVLKNPSQRGLHAW